MSTIYFISDLHFGHENMAIKRGFKNHFEHDEYIISQWNKIITKKDTVWILGDITMEKDLYYFRLDQLNGIKKVVLGNHDMPQHVPELLKYVNKVCGMYDYKDLCLSHCPIHENEIGRYRKNYHGHIHENTYNDSRYINCCAEVLNYKPILLI